jgi:predicted flap endonuclease-1-like 5' DNA nuclease
MGGRVMSKFLEDVRFYGLVALSIILVAIAILVRSYDETISIYILGGSLIIIAFMSYLLYGPPATAPESRKPRKKEAEAKPKPEEPIPKVTKKPKSDDKHAEIHTPEVVQPAVSLNELPIETIEGIGEKYGKMLRAKGIDSVDDLINADPVRIAEITDVSFTVAKRWVAMSRFTWLDGISEEDAEAIVFATGIKTVKALARADPTELLEKIKNAVALGDVRIPADYEFTIEKARKWVESARDAA